MPGVGEAEVVDPVDFAEQADDLAEGHQYADEQDPEDEPVEARVGEEGGDDLRRENERHEAGDDEKHQHPHEVDPGGRHLAGIDTGGLLFEWVAFQDAAGAAEERGASGLAISCLRGT